MDITNVISSAQGLLSNTYLVDAPDGVVVVDPPMLLSDARAVRKRLEELDRPLAAFIYTHPHPDHVNGATEIRDGADVPVYATPECDRISRAIDGPKRVFWIPIYGEDYPPQTTFPSRLVSSGAAVTIAGLDFEVHDVGPGECETAALWVSGETAFVGDLVYSNAHPWLFEGRSRAWLDQLQLAKAIVEGKQIFVGHGAPGSATLVDTQADYIHAYQKAVRELSSRDGNLSDEAKNDLTRRMSEFWPDAALGDLIALSADPIAAELARAV